MNAGTDYEQINGFFTSNNDMHKNVYLGYKTTTNKGEALTDISLMNMNGGFKRLNYYASAEESMSGFSELVDCFVAMITEFKNNYDNYIELTDISYDMLNELYVPGTVAPNPAEGGDEDEKKWLEEAGYNGCMRLGYYLCENLGDDTPDAKLEFEQKIKELLLISNSQIVTLLFNAVATGLAIRYEEMETGVAVVKKQISWLDELSKNGPETSPDAISLYNVDANKILPSVSTFSAGIKAALARQATGTTGTAEEQSADYIHLTCYNILKECAYGDKGTLADLFTKETIEATDLFAMAKALSKAQIAAIQTTGVEILLLNSKHTAETLQKTINDYKAKKFDDALSVYAGVNTDIYSDEVALTQATYRNLSESSSINSLTSTKDEDNFEYQMKQIELWGDVVSKSAGAIAAVGNAVIPIAFTAYASLLEFLIDDNTKIVDFYPLASVLKPEELAAMKVAGMSMTVKFGNNSKETWEKLNGEYASVISSDMIDEETQQKVEWISMYYDVDRTLFNGNVAVTSAAKRNTVAGSGVFDKSGLSIKAKTRIVEGAIGGIAIVGAIVSSFFKFTNIIRIPAQFETVVVNVTQTALKGGGVVLENANDFFKLSSAQRQALMSGGIKYETVIIGTEEIKKEVTAASSMTKITAAGCVFGVCFAVLAIVGAFTAYTELSDFYDTKYTPIPDLMYDYINTASKTAFVRYEAVRTMDNKPGDINAYCGPQWIGMYTTKDQSAGAPIKTGFLVQSTVDGVDSVYEGVHWFGQNSAAELNAYTYADKNDIFMFFDRDETAITASNTASAFSTGTIVLIATLSALGGAGICFVGMFAVSKRNKKENNQ